jgi:hypothetical protein
MSKRYLVKEGVHEKQRNKNKLNISLSKVDFFINNNIIGIIRSVNGVYFRTLRIINI